MIYYFLQLLFVFGRNAKIDILKGTINVLKKFLGFDKRTLKNQERAVIIDVLTNKYSLPELCNRMDLPKSSYDYQERVFHQGDKYAELR